MAVLVVRLAFTGQYTTVLSGLNQSMLLTHNARLVCSHRGLPCAASTLRGVAIQCLATDCVEPLCAQYPLCLSLLEHKRVNVLPMITHRFGFSEGGIADGFDTAARSAQTKAIKVMFNL